jgi:peptidoglycan-associated lipoprotein
MSTQRFLFTSVILLTGVLTIASSAQNTGSTVSPVPDATDGKDYAGRPVEVEKVPAPAPLAPTEQQEFAQAVKDIHFDFGAADLRPEDQEVLNSDAAWLKAHPEVMIVLHADADERGDIVYNLVLSDRRAIATRDALITQGVPADRILFATGWGKLYPVCTSSDESCWSQNRRTHIEAWQNLTHATQVASR